MKLNFLKAKYVALGLITAAISVSSCNKIPLAPVPIPQAADGPNTIGTLLNGPSYTFFKAAATKAGMIPTLSAANLRWTLFLPDDNAFIASGIPSVAIINNNAIFDTPTVKAIVNYHIIPQTIRSTSVPTTFPNFYYPTNFNPFPAVSPLLRLDNYPSRRANGFWVNNIPVIAPDIAVDNGVVHQIARLVAPPSRMLLQRIAADADMTYLYAAIIRADSGISSSSTSSLIWALSNFGPNLTVYAPTNLAFQQIMTGLIAQALIAQGVPPAVAAAQAASLASTPGVFSNPALYPFISAQTVRGVIVYHILGTRAFSVNMPSTATYVPTLLNSAVPQHPGVQIQASFLGPFVTAATVKGLANPSASNILVNPTPEPNGTSDQLYVNGILHKIDQVLRPQ